MLLLFCLTVITIIISSMIIIIAIIIITTYSYWYIFIVILIIVLISYVSEINYLSIYLSTPDLPVAHTIRKLALCREENSTLLLTSVKMSWIIEYLCTI